MFPKKIIGKYLGGDRNGVTIGKVQFLQNSYVECNVTEDMFNQIVELCNQGEFYLFEFASVSRVLEITEELNNDIDQSLYFISEGIVAIGDGVIQLSEAVTTKYDDVELVDNDLSFYSGEDIIKTISLPIPERPRDIELGKNDTHIIWRYKPIGKEYIPWEELVLLTEITGAAYDDTELRNRIEALESK